MIWIGCHLSVSKGYAAMGRAMLELGGNTFAWFTRNPRGGRTKDIAPGDAEALNALRGREGFGPLVAHGSYTMNLCAANPETRANALDMLRQDVERMALFPGCLYNFHPGSHMGQGVRAGVEMIAAALDAVIAPDAPVTALLESMAGKGSEVGGSFEELRAVIDRAACRDRLGVCFDTCHVWDAGYDIASDLDGVLARFDDVIGLDRLRAVHLNDSLNDCGARRDRHAKLGEGRIGPEALRRVVRHPALQGKPFILETPNDDEGYRREIRLVREWTEG